jgi:ubiquinone biosynthesis protein
MKEQVGWRGFIERLKIEAPHYAHILPQLPRLLQQALVARAEAPQNDNGALLSRLLAEQKRTNLLLGVAVYFGGGLVVGILVVQLFLRWHSAL